MSSTRYRNLAVLLGALSLAAPVCAGFKDPIESPAPMWTQRGRLTAVASAGGQLVVAGPSGYVARSTDNGKTWRQAQVPVSSDLVALQFVDAEYGWAVGHDGIVLRTVDGGRSWTKQLDGRQAAASALAWYKKRSAAGDPDAATGLEEAQRLIDDGADKPFLDVRFLDRKEGFVIGAFNLALHTRDGGVTWEPLLDRTANPGFLHLYGMAANGHALYMVGEQGLVRRWNRETERFEKLASPYNGSLFGIVARDGLLVVYGMRGNSFSSRDGGQSWNKIDTGSSAGITGGTVLGDGRILLANQNGQLLMGSAMAERFIPLKTASTMPYFGISPAGKDAVAVVGALGVAIEAVVQR
jgi:photosystem II stability/assembly factor-like uncharacterized protein